MQIIRRNSWWLLENRAIFYLVFISACLFESVVVVFIPLYTLAGFYIPPPPPAMLPSYFHLQLSYFQNFSSIIFHISYIPHFSLSWSFSRFFFSNVFSSGFSTLFFPISFQLCFLSGGHYIFPIRGQLFQSYFFFARCHTPNFPLFLTVSMFSFSNFFTDSYRVFPIHCHVFHLCHVHLLLVCFFFVSLCSVSILPFHCLRIPVPSVNTRHSLQNVVFPEFSFNSKSSHSFTSLICY